MKKVLLIKLSSLGDVVFNIPLANTLKANGYEVHWLTTEKGIDIIEGNPCSDKTFFLPLYTWRKKFKLRYIFDFIKLIFSLRKEKYDIAFDCQRRLKSLPFMLLCGAKRRIISHYSTEGARFGANEVMPEETEILHMVNLNLLYAKYLGLDTTEIKMSLPEQPQEVKDEVSNLLSDVNKSKPLLILAPATTWPAKHWAVKNWKDLYYSLQDKYSIVFTGMEQDKELINKIGDGEQISLAGKTKLCHLIELFSRADLVIAPDSGSAHLAWASGKPNLIEIFCCTGTNFFGCFGNPKKYFTVQDNLPCQPCNKRKCRFDSDECTKFPPADEVIKIAENLLEQE